MNCTSGVGGTAATLMEFSLANSGSQDFYDISLYVVLLCTLVLRPFLPNFAFKLLISREQCRWSQRTCRDQDQHRVSQC